MSMTQGSMLQGSNNYVWSLADMLGQGATGGVFKGRNKKTGELCAVKTFNEIGYMRPHHIQIREFDIIQKLKHKNIVKLIGIEEELSTRGKVIIMELCTGGSLYNILFEPENAYGLPDTEFLIVLHDVADGMKYLRDQGFVHRDIKPGNIMKCISDDGRAVYKLTDFGAARQLEDGDQFMSLYGTEEYLCPDMYERAVLRVPSHKQYDASVDLWSLGVTFYQVAAGQLPFRPYGGRKNRETMYYITTKKESGVISGVQHKEDASIEWSRELPRNCRLSIGARKLVTPLLAGLLETDPSRIWTHDRFFEEVLKVRHKTLLHVFSFPTNSLLSIYVDKNAKLAQVQALITEQTDLHANRQELAMNQTPLSTIIDPMQEAGAYPDTSPSQPFTLYSTANADFPVLPNIECPGFPSFPSSMMLDTDLTAVQSCCSALHLFLRFIEDFCLRKKLLTTAIWQYLIILSQDMDHVKYYMSWFEKTCKETQQCLAYLMESHSTNMKLLKLYSTDKSNLRNMEDWRSKLHPITKDIQAILQTIADSQNRMTNLQRRVVQRRNFLTSWKESNATDVCSVLKIKVILETVMEIRESFQRDKAKKRLSFNDEQIHKFDRMKVTELCTKALSLLEHCHNDLKQHFAKVQDWFNIVCPIRQQLYKLERDVANLIETKKAISLSIQGIWINYQEDMNVWISENCGGEIVADSVLELPTIPAVVEPSDDNPSPLSSSVDPPSPQRQSLIDTRSYTPKSSEKERDKIYKKELICKLQENLKNLGDETHCVRNAIQEGADLIKQFEEALSSNSLEMVMLSNDLPQTGRSSGTDR